MKRYFLFLLFLILPFFPALAQMQDFAQRAGEITTQQQCGVLVNRSEQTIMGTLSTMGQKIASGDIVHHRDNFKLEAGARKEFCSTGPFFEGRRLEVTLRTVIPLFSCKTKIDKEIFLDAKLNEDGVKKLSATCY